MAKKGWKHVGTYADDGLSGSLEAHERPDLQRLMADSVKTPRPFDMVVVNEGRAIGRTGRAFWRWVWDLEDLGVYVAVVDGDFDNSTDEGRARMRDAASYAEKERERSASVPRAAFRRRPRTVCTPEAPSPSGGPSQTAGTSSARRR
ncbi:recombinase family protein [Streptomyces hypolithicus]